MKTDLRKKKKKKRGLLSIVIDPVNRLKGQSLN